MAVEAWIDRLERALDRLHPADHILQLAGGGLEVLVEVLQPGSRVAVGGEGVVVLGPHAGHVLDLFGELGPEGVRVGPQRGQRSLQAEEGLDLVPQQ